MQLDLLIVRFYNTHPIIEIALKLSVIAFSIYMAYKVNQHAESDRQD